MALDFLRYLNASTIMYVPNFDASELFSSYSFWPLNFP
jgi:hypothetical protein